MDQTPGESLQKILAAQDCSVETFAKNVGLALPDAQKLLAGQFAIDAKLAHELARACGNDAAYWLRREKEYRHGP